MWRDQSKVLQPRGNAGRSGTALSQEEGGGRGMSNQAEESGVAWAGDANKSSGEWQGRKVGKAGDNKAEQGSSVA